MSDSKFLHVGITVEDMEKTILFYTKYFNFKLDMRGVFPEEFISNHHPLYQLDKGAYSDFCFLKSPDGIVLELFQFHPEEKGKMVKWNQPGYHHICLKVDDIFQVYEQMKNDGVEFYFAPDERGSKDAHWVFLKDPDGNMIELQD